MRLNWLGEPVWPRRYHGASWLGVASRRFLIANLPELTMPSLASIYWYRKSTRKTPTQLIPSLVLGRSSNRNRVLNYLPPALTHAVSCPKTLNRLSQWPTLSVGALSLPGLLEFEKCDPMVASDDARRTSGDPRPRIRLLYSLVASMKRWLALVGVQWVKPELDRGIGTRKGSC